MQGTRISLFATLLRTVADWASIRHGTPKPSARAERRRRARQRLKNRAALADLYQAAALDLGAQVEGLRQMVDELNTERHGMIRRADSLEGAVNDLLQRNVDLMGLCATHQHQAEHWRRMVEAEDGPSNKQFGNILQ
ncbi:hypothetical protein [Xanthobacter autotrophicus]|uniref:hypothetical protein n=1 Tax=Xanthobacter autotrophicus TaxID=280 RepID=UPI0024A693A7|nr:hypothetical protein [Xanthobacter autotrophicus]MDI4655526.1 hypothetical protein [Xanthobacter autotrophicus]